MPRPIDALGKPLDEVVRKAEVFAKAVAKVRDDFESHYRDNRKRLLAYAWEIAYAIDSGDERRAHEFACACLRANRSRTAQPILQSLALSDNKTSKYVASARRRLARLTWKIGDTETAVQTLRAVRGRAAKSQYRHWLGILTIRNGLLLGESGDIDSAREVLMGGLLATGMDQSMARAVTAIYLKATCRSSLDDGLAETPGAGDRIGSLPEEPPTAVILSGFGWSGSGAVADFLKGHPQVADIFSGREIGWWTGRYGLDRLYAHFIAKGFNRRLLLEFLTRHCFGHSFLADGKGTKNVGGMWSWLEEPGRRMLLQALAEWLDVLQKWHADPAVSILEAFQALSSRVLQLLSEKKTTCVLLSNCIPSDAIAGIRMFNAPVVIVSWRNPGDAYASKIAAFPDNTLTLSRWERQLTSRIDSYLVGKKEVAGCARLWMDLSFEEFVRDEDLRRQLLVLLDLHRDTMESTFDPSASAKNIGILKAGSARTRSAWNALACSVEETRARAQAISGQDTDVECPEAGQSNP